jgi:hypothetical protein
LLVLLQLAEDAGKNHFARGGQVEVAKEAPVWAHAKTLKRGRLVGKWVDRDVVKALRPLESAINAKKIELLS